MKVTMKGLQDARRKVKLTYTKFILAIEIFDAPKASRITIIICNHDGWIE
jgi:hypothetical protein